MNSVRAVLASALVFGVVACGDGAPSDGDGESWPPTLAAPAVLGYVVLRVEPERVAAFFDEHVGWRPAGLAEGRSLCALWLDASVMGGDTGLCLPVDDEDVFRRSLEEAESIAALGGDRYELRLPPDHPVAMARRAMRSMGDGGPDPANVLSALSEPAGVSMPLLLSFEDDYALLMPSYEASVVTRRALDELAGLQRADAEGLVLNVDVTRFADAYRNELDGLMAQLRNLRLGAGAAGAAALALQARGGDLGGIPGMPELPVNGEFLWTLIDMVRMGDLQAVQWRGASPADGAFFGESRGAAQAADGRDTSAQDAGARDADETSGASVSTLRVRFVDGSPWLALFGSTRPAPPLPDASLVLAADATRFADACAEFLRPVAEFVKGEGPPAERFAQQFAELLRPWSGVAARLDDREGRAVFALSLQPGAVFDAEAARAWCATLASAASWKGPAFWETDPDDLAAAAGDGLAWLTFDGALLLADPHAAGVEAHARSVSEAARAWAEDDAPFLRAAGDAGTLRAHLRGRDLVLEVTAR